MEIINAYFDGIVFLKTDQKENYTIYASAISSSFGDGSKTYALAFVPAHMAILDRGYLKDLHWQNFQTRTLTNGWKIANQRWDLRKLKGLPTPMFDVVERNEIKTKYKCESEPLEMILLHDPKKKSIYQYHNRINMLAALSTFRCVLNFAEGHEMQATRVTHPGSSILPHQNSLGASYAKHDGKPPSSIPISSLAVRAPQQSPLYRPTDLPNNTTYIPRNEGTRYAANSASAAEGEYEFNHSTVVGNTGYRTLALDITVPGGGHQPESYEQEEERVPINRGRRGQKNTRDKQSSHFSEFQNMQESVDDSFELL